eukprot:2135215-Prymnesium_polylepis.1
MAHMPHAPITRTVPCGVLTVRGRCAVLSDRGVAAQPQLERGPAAAASTSRARARRVVVSPSARIRW